MCAHMHTPHPGAQRRVNCEYLILPLSPAITSSLNKKENKIFQEEKDKISNWRLMENTLKYFPFVWKKKMKHSENHTNNYSVILPYF